MVRNQAHTLGYSLVGLQEMNLAYKYPIIFWNTANLIVDSAGSQDEKDEDNEEIIGSELEETEEEELVDIYELEDWEEYDYEDLPDRSAKKKKKVKTVDFGKIAIAIGKFQKEGIKITPPDINKSGFTFTPDVTNNAIASGLRNLTRISADLVNTIIANRPYSSIEDFMSKVKVNKTQMLNLLKCGAFDSIYPDRIAAIKEYVSSIAGTKGKLTLANIPTLVKYNILDDEAKEYIEMYYFNRFIRKNKSPDNEDILIFPNESALNYYCNRFDADLLLDGCSIYIKDWEKQYKKAIMPLSEYIKENMDELLNSLNTAIVEEQFGLYLNGTISKFEMQSMSFYYHEHELANVDRNKYDIVNFDTLSSNPSVKQRIPTKDGEILIYNLTHIFGTVLNKNKNKGTVTLLTPDGVVNVKIWKNQFAKYDKRISVINDEGKKKIAEESWFQRGSLLYIQGIRRGNDFIPKAYKNSWHTNPIMKIISCDGPDFVYTSQRFDET